MATDPSERSSGTWFSFAETGTPAGEVAWPKHTTGGLLKQDKTLKLGEQIVVANPRRCRPAA
ncbi:hypothetical protein WMF38_04495 [Sorangium sp. So ce118]